MRFPTVNEDTLVKMATILSMSAVSGYDNKQKTIAALAQADETELWLLSFIRYLLGSTTYKGIDMNPYLMFPCSEKQTVFFPDFVKLLNTALRAKVLNKANEKYLIQFLLGCTEEVRQFYWLCLEQPKWLAELFRINEVREYATVLELTGEDLHGETTFLSYGWIHIKFPLALTSIPDVKLPNGVIYRGGKYRYFKVASYVPTKVGSPKRFKLRHLKYYWLKDHKNIHTPEFVLLGKIDVEGGKFYPYDYFNTSTEFAWFRRGKPRKPYQERIAELTVFMQTNFLKNIERSPVIYCDTSHNIEARLSEVLRGAKYNNIVAYDGRMNHVYALPTVPREGAIGDLWTECGEVRGFIVWYQGSKVHAGYEFTGYDQAILYNPKVIKGTLVKFSYFEYADYKVGAVTEILWDKPKYRRLPLKFSNGEVGYVERCPMCLQQIKHRRNGVCYSTIKNFGHFFARHGPDVWFTPSVFIQKRREEHGYDFEFVNKVDLKYKGHRFVANDKGEFMFQSDEEYMYEYQHYVNTHPETKFCTREQLQERYQRNMMAARKEYRRGTEEARILREVPELYEPNLISFA